MLVTERVNVVGTHDLTRAQVSFAAQVPLGVPLVRQDLNAIAADEHSAGNRDSDVIRDWPRTITVAVVEAGRYWACSGPGATSG